MKKVTLLTNVHNGERFVEKTIRSVLNQTEPDFWYFIRLNACTDGSEEIVRRYAQQDDRIVVLKNTVNYVTDEGIPSSQRGFWPDFDSEYVAVLDHDDILKPNFVECLYNAGHKASADLVIGGCGFFDDATGEVIGERIPPCFTGSNNEVKEYFTDLYGSLRTRWGKLFRAELMDKFYDELHAKPQQLTVCTDTWLVLSFLECCKCIVSVDKPLLLYRQSSESQFFAKKPDEARIYEGKILFEKGVEYLKLVGGLNVKNVCALYSVHAGHMVDLIRIIQCTTAMSSNEKLRYLQQILAEDHLATYRDNAVYWLSADIEECMEQIVATAQDPDELWWSYLFRLEYLKGCREKSEKELLIYWSILADPANKLKYGMEILENMEWTLLPHDESVWMQLTTRQKLTALMGQQFDQVFFRLFPSSEKKNEIEQKIVAAMGQNQWSQAYQWLQKLEQITVVSETGVFCRLMLVMMEGQPVQTKAFAQIAKAIFPHSEPIQDMCGQID